MSNPQFQRNTRQRQVILEELRKVNSHPTAGELHEIVRRRLPKISLGTVYRNLELLAGMSVIQKLQIGGETRFDGDTRQHDHVRCVQCGRVEDIEGEPLALDEGRHHACRGYEIHGHRLELLGTCPACRRKQQAASKETEAPETP